MPTAMAALPQRGPAPGQNLDRSPEPKIFQNSPGSELLAGLLVPLPFTVQLHPLCYDLIHLGLGPIPEPRPAQSDPQVFQPSCVARCNASCDLAPMHTSACLHVLTRECVAPEGPCTSPAYVPYS